MDCPHCDEELRHSVTMKDADEVLFKSCPSCSERAASHVFYDTEQFGWRYGGRIIQSWCAACRAGEQPPPPAGRCPL